MRDFFAIPLRIRLLQVVITEFGWHISLSVWPTLGWIGEPWRWLDEVVVV